MNDILIVGQVPPPLNGSNVMADALFNALKRNGKNPHLVDKRFSAKTEDVGHFRLGKIFKVPSLWWRTWIAALHNRHSTAIYFTSSRFGAFVIDLVNVWGLNLLNHKVIAYLHTSDYHLLGSRSKLHTKLVKSFFKQFSSVVVLSKEMANDIEIYRPGGGIKIIPNAIQPRLPSGRKTQSEHEMTALFLSNISQEKGIFDFIEVALATLSLGIRMNFVVAGGVSDEVVFEAALNRFKEVGNSISYVGPLLGEAKWECLAAADILIYPSYADALPLTLIEAASIGLPVVAYEVGGIPSIITDGETGILCPVGNVPDLINATSALATNAELRRNFSRSGREKFANTFTLDKFERNWIRLVAG